MVKDYALAAKYLLVFGIFFAIFFMLHQSIGGFWSLDDPYYHARHAALMAETGDLALVRPWIAYHWLSYAPTDPWWGYHVIAAGFIKLFGLLLGVKILASTVSAAVFSVLFFLLYRFGVPRPEWWTGAFFFSSFFLEFRLMLERPFVLSMIFLPLSLWFLIKRKHFLLFFISAVFALLYNQAPLLVLMPLMFLAAEYLINRRLGTLKPLIAVLSGLAAGILLHPYSLNYLFLMFMHLWQVLYLKFSGLNLGIGDEVQTRSFGRVLADGSIAGAAYIISLALYLAFIDLRKSPVAVALFLSSGFWFLASFFIPRALDLWFPLAWLFIAVNFKNFRALPVYGMMISAVKRRVNLTALWPLVLVTTLVVGGYNFVDLMSYRYDRLELLETEKNFQEAMVWLKRHTPPGSIVFYEQWGLWPQAFYHNDWNRYIAGIDPTFLYEYDPALFWLWKNLAEKGEPCDRQNGCVESGGEQRSDLVYQSLKERLNSPYLVIRNRAGDKLLQILEREENHYQAALKNDDFVVFSLK